MCENTVSPQRITHKIEFEEKYHFARLKINSNQNDLNYEYVQLLKMH